VVRGLAWFALVIACSSQELSAQAGSVRGVVTDTAGRPVAGAEVRSTNPDRTTRTADDGRFMMVGLDSGPQLLLARRPGYQLGQHPVTIRPGATETIEFRLRFAVQTVDTVRIVSHDACEPYALSGFDCRRGAGIGQFRSSSELAALRPLYWADMFTGFDGLRRVPWHRPRWPPDWTVRSTTGWSCLAESWNGSRKSASDSLLGPKDILAIEYYDLYEKVPSAYKWLAWQGAAPCALVLYWTKHADRVPKQKRK